MGVARFELIARGAKYFIIIDAPGYDLQTVELPHLWARSSPAASGSTPKAAASTPSTPTSNVQVMVSVEPK